MLLKRMVESVTPPVVARMAARFCTEPRAAFAGNYATWDAALRDSTGYDSGAILQKTREALLKVKRGEVACERDSVVFDKIQYSFPLLAGLLRAAVSSGGYLGVLDFGGSLGSSYFQCRSFLQPVTALEWLVVEQPAHVACGREDFESEQLHFYHTVEECLTKHKPNVLLLSSVLQYLPGPYEQLHQLLQHAFNYVLVDRTAFLQGGGERLTVQHVKPSIYDASYPAWFFDEGKFVNAITSCGYGLLADASGRDVVQLKGGKSYFKSFIFERPRRT